MAAPEPNDVNWKALCENKPNTIFSLIGNNFIPTIFMILLILTVIFNGNT